MVQFKIYRPRQDRFWTAFSSLGRPPNQPSRPFQPSHQATIPPIFSGLGLPSQSPVVSGEERRAWRVIQARGPQGAPLPPCLGITHEIKYILFVNEAAKVNCQFCGSECLGGKKRPTVLGQFGLFEICPLTWTV